MWQDTKVVTLTRTVTGFVTETHMGKSHVHLASGHQLQ